MNLRKFALSSVCILGLGSTALAQQPSVSPSQQEETTKKPRTGGQVQSDQGKQLRQETGQNAKSSATKDDYAKSKDKMIAECIALANFGEVSLGKFAEEHSQTPAVKDFAKMMVEDHQSMLEKLQSYVPEASSAGFFKEAGSKAADSTKRDATQRSKQTVKEGQETKREVAGQQTENQQAQNRSENRSGVSQAGNTAPSQQRLAQDVSLLHRELAEQCLADSKSMLSEKEGSEFDRCYVNTQIVKHASMLSNLTVFQRHASGELEQIINQGMETTKKHLKHAENLIEQLDGSKSTANSGRKNQDRK